MRKPRPTPSRWPCGRRWLALAWVLLLATGCRLDLAIDVAVGRDGQGELAVALAADAELREQARRAGVDPLADFAAAGEALASAGWRVTDTERADGARQVRLSAPFDDPGEFNVLAEDLAGALAAPEVRLLEELRLTVGDADVVVRGRAGLQPTEAVAELGLTPEEAVALARDETAVGYQLQVTLPGEVVETSADHVDGPVLTWQVAPGEDAVLHAVGVRPDPPVWPLVVGALVGTAVAALLIGVRRRW